MIRVIYQDGSEGCEWEVGDRCLIERGEGYSWLSKFQVGQLGTVIRVENSLHAEVRWSKDWGPARLWQSGLKPCAETVIRGWRHTRVTGDPTKGTCKIDEGPIMPCVPDIAKPTTRVLEL